MIEYYKNGNIKRKEFYKNGHSIFEKEFRVNGQLKNEYSNALICGKLYQNALIFYNKNGLIIKKSKSHLEDSKFIDIQVNRNKKIMQLKFVGLPKCDSIFIELKKSFCSKKYIRKIAYSYNIKNIYNFKYANSDLYDNKLKIKVTFCVFSTILYNKKVNGKMIMCEKIKEPKKLMEIDKSFILYYERKKNLPYNTNLIY